MQSFVNDGESSISAYLRKYPPCTTSAQRETTLKERQVRDDDLAGIGAPFKAPINDLSWKIQTTIAIRIIGSTLLVAGQFAVLCLLILPTVFVLASHYLRIIRPVTHRPAGEPLWQKWRLVCTLLSAVIQFILLPIFTAGFTSCTREYKAPIERVLGRLNHSFLCKVAVLMQARVYASFASIFLLTFSSSVEVTDLILAGFLGIYTLLSDYISFRFHIDWSALVVSNAPSFISAAKKRSMLSTTIHFIAFTLVYTLITYTFEDMIEERRSAYWLLPALTLLTPFPTLGFHGPFGRPSLKRHLCVCFASLWLTPWIERSVARFQSVIYSRVLWTTRDYLLAMNCRDWTSQLCLMAHIQSGCKVDDQQVLNPPASFIFIESELSLMQSRAFASPYKLAGDMKRDIDSEIARHKKPAYILPEVPLPVLSLATDLQSDFPRFFPRSMRRKWIEKFQVAWFDFARFTMRSLCSVLPCELSRALTVAFSQAQNGMMHWIVYGLSPEVFLGLTPADFPNSRQKAMLLGSRRQGLVSPFTNNKACLLSAEATSLIFGDQTLPAFTSRLTAIIRGVDNMLSVAITLLGTPPTGCIPNSVGSTVFRYENTIRDDLKKAVEDLVSPSTASTSKTLLKFTARDLPWLLFGDQTVGLGETHREELLRIVRETLSTALTTALVGLDAARRIHRVRVLFDPEESSAGQPLRVLRPYFPSMENEKEAAIKPTTMPATLIEAISSCRKRACVFAEIPDHPPLAVRCPYLADLAERFAIYADLSRISTPGENFLEKRTASMN